MPISTLHRDAHAFPSAEERAGRGRAARELTSLATLAEHDRDHPRDPVALFEGQARSRVPELVPVRHGRMASSPFAFYRGAALVMADDLSRSPNSGLRVQLCGDAHLGNFGFFATPERKLAFDVNDFDETYPGPFEWDVKRLVASLAIAAEENGYSKKQRDRITRAAAAEYRETMLRQAERSTLAVWYSHAEPSAQLTELRDVLDSSTKKTIRKLLKKARTRDSVQALDKLTTQANGEHRIVSMPPLIVPIETLFADRDAHALYEELGRRLDGYRANLRPEVRTLLDQFQLVQAARKVVGVGSVGTRSWIMYLRGAGAGDPLFLQAKEAQPSVLESYLDGPRYANQGERVVVGQRLIQAVSDVFLGWESGPGADGVERDFYVRQLRDGKGSVVVEALTPTGMTAYARTCGRVLAYGHARTGDRIAIAAYLGSGSAFDDAMATFAGSYAKQNRRDHAAFRDAITQRRIDANTER
jgi:uncharacterized protein (DUF2252 family)